MGRKFLITVLAVVAMLFAADANAQVKLGLKGGVNVTDMKFNSSVFKADNRIGFFAGPTIKFTLPIVGLNVDLSALYDQREAKVEDQTLLSKSVMVPLNLRYSMGLGRKLAFFVFAGPQFAFNISDDKDVDEFKEDVKSWRLKESNFSVNVGAGFTINHIELFANYNVVIGKTGDFNFKDTFDALSEGTARANAWQMGLAFFF